MSANSLHAAEDRFAAVAGKLAGDLYERLVADALAHAAGEPCRGGIRALWRQHVRHLAELRTDRAALPPPELVR